MKNLFLLAIFSIPLFISSAQASSFFPAPLIQAEWLVEHSDEVLILDTRKDLTSFTKQGHIENAHLINVNKIRLDKIIDGKTITRMRPNKQQFESFMQQHGVNQDSKIVITHQGLTAGHVAGAARLYWHLKTYNVDVALLDGGNAAWVTALEDLIDETPSYDKGNYQVQSENLLSIASMADVQKAMHDTNTQLIDTRSLRYHIGLNKKDYVYDFGHIPPSKNLPYKFLNPLKGMAVYLTETELSQMIKNLNIDSKKDKILYCNSAYECSSVWFVFHEILGQKNIKIYDGSLHQWTQYNENPMTRTLGE